MSNCYPLPIPLHHKLHELPTTPPNSLLDIHDKDITVNFQWLVGSLIYLAVCTCPDITYVAMALGQYNVSATRTHLLAMKGVLHYLAGTLDLSLEFGMDQSVIAAPVHGLVQCCGVKDADWATDEKDHQSISGYCFYFLNSLVSWSSTKQKTVSLSSTKSKYYTLTHAMKEALWIYLFLTIHCLPVRGLYSPPGILPRIWLESWNSARLISEFDIPVESAWNIWQSLSSHHHHLFFPPPPTMLITATHHTLHHHCPHDCPQMPTTTNDHTTTTTTPKTKPTTHK